MSTKNTYIKSSYKTFRLSQVDCLNIGWHFINYNPNSFFIYFLLRLDLRRSGLQCLLFRFYEFGLYFYTVMIENLFLLVWYVDGRNHCSKSAFCDS